MQALLSALLSTDNDIRSKAEVSRSHHTPAHLGTLVWRTLTAPYLDTARALPASTFSTVQSPDCLLYRSPTSSCR